MRLRKKRVSFIIFTGMSLVIISSLVVFLILSYFPWEVNSPQYETASSNHFTSVWPMRLSEVEAKEIKKVKRFTRAEQLRRLQQKLARMNVLQNTIFNVMTQSTNSDLISSNENVEPAGTAFSWPLLSTSQKLMSQDLKNERGINKIVVPEAKFTRLSDSFFLQGGEDLKITVFLDAKERYNLTFDILPLSPGNLRVFLGQYVWVKTFTEEDVHKKNKIVIPINDRNASVLRFSSVSLSGYFLNVNLNHLENSGRIPIQVSKNSPLWVADEKLLLHGNTSSWDKTDPVINLKDMPIAKAFEYVNSQTANSQILSQSEQTVALGYNFVLAHLNNIPEELKKDPIKFSKIMPNLYLYLKNAQEFELEGIQNDSSLLMRNAIYPAPFPNIIENKDIISKIFSEKKYANLYRIVKDFGYVVNTFTYPEALFMPYDTCLLPKYLGFTSRYLIENDLPFIKTNRLLTEKNSNTEGLEAIFKTNTNQELKALSANDFQDLRTVYQYLMKAEVENNPDWSSTEYLLFDNRKDYSQNLLFSFQKILEEYKQKRIFSHVMLNNDEIVTRPTLKNLMDTLKRNGMFTIFRPAQLVKYSKLIYWDRSFGDLLDTIKSKGLTHRTIVSIIMHPSQFNANSTAAILIPGLIPKRNHKMKATLNDIIATSISHLGIPLGNNITKSFTDYPGKMLEAPAIKIVESTEVKENEKEKSDVNTKASSHSNTSSDEMNFYRFKVTILPEKEDCRPFSWKSAADKPNEPFIFNLSTNLPFVELNRAKNEIDFYPCAKDFNNQFLQAIWIQKAPHHITQETKFNQFIGGYIDLIEHNTRKNIPHFYFGSQFISYLHPIFISHPFKTTLAKDIFFLKNSWKENDSLDEFKEFLYQNKKYDSHLKKTVVHFYITEINDATMLSKNHLKTIQSTY